MADTTGRLSEFRKAFNSVVPFQVNSFGDTDISTFRV